MGDHDPTCLYAMKWEAAGVPERIGTEQCQFCRQARRARADERTRIAAVKKECGGCKGLGSHQRWCPAVVGTRASALGPYSEALEDLGDRIGSLFPRAANECYRVSRLVFDRAATESEMWQEREGERNEREA